MLQPPALAETNLENKDPFYVLTGKAIPEPFATGSNEVASGMESNKTAESNKFKCLNARTPETEFLRHREV